MSRYGRSSWMFLAPMLVVLALAALWPLLRTIVLSFTDASLSSSDYDFVWFSNYFEVDGEHYEGVLADPMWWQSVYNTLRFTVISVSLETVFGLIIALVLNVEFKGRGLLRAAILVPWAIPTIVSARMWNWMLHDQFGVINHVLLSLGFIDHPIAWTADPELAMWAIIIVDVWKTTPFMVILILASLQMLPSESYQAAKIDGISPVVLFFKVTLPLIAPGLMVAVVFRVLDALRIFDLIYVLNVNTKTISMSVYARQQLVEFQDAGFGSAASTMVFFTIALVVMFYLYLTRKQLN